MKTGPLVLLIVLLLVAPPAFSATRAEQAAAREQERQQQRNQINSEIANLDRQIGDARDRVSNINKSLSAAKDDQATAKSDVSKAADLLKSSAKEFDAANKAAGDAKDKSDQADKKLRDATAAARQKFELMSEMVAAKQELADARDAQQVARVAAIAPIRSDPEYFAATKDVKTASDAVEKLRLSPTSDPKAMSTAAETLLAKQAAVAALEQKALAGDREFQAAETRVNTASKAWTTFQTGIAEKVRTDPARIAAQKDADDAQADESKQQVALKAAVQRQANAKAMAGKAADRAETAADQVSKLQKDLERKQGQIDDFNQQRDRKVRQLSAVR